MPLMKQSWCYPKRKALQVDPFVFAYSGAAILAKFGTKRITTLHSPRNDLNSVRDVDGWSLRLPLVLCDTTSKHLGRMMCSR